MVLGAVGTDVVVCSSVAGTNTVDLEAGGVAVVVTDKVDGWEGVVEGQGSWNLSISQVLLQTA